MVFWRREGWNCYYYYYRCFEFISFADKIETKQMSIQALEPFVHLIFFFFPRFCCCCCCFYSSTLILIRNLLSIFYEIVSMQRYWWLKSIFPLRKYKRFRWTKKEKNYNNNHFLVFLVKKLWWGIFSSVFILFIVIWWMHIIRAERHGKRYIQANKSRKNNIIQLFVFGMTKINWNLFCLQWFFCWFQFIIIIAVYRIWKWNLSRRAKNRIVLI